MGDLVLDSLEIRGFRGFRHLQIEHLGRVNLIVGKNNVGKTSLLEALHLYTRRGRPALIWELLRERDESINIELPREANIERMLSSLKYLFYGREDITILSASLQIGPMRSPKDVMALGVGWYKFQDNGGHWVLLAPSEEYDIVDGLEPRFTVQLGAKAKKDYPLSGKYVVLSKRPDMDLIHCIFTKADGLSEMQLNELWANVSLTPLEEDVLSALRIVAPGIEALNILGESPSNRTIFVKVASIGERIPLRSLGNGMLRMLGVALALVNAKDGFLLIDEIENGLHFSIQSDLWQLIFRLAHRLNVQVFATTHSWDCIEAFQEAAQEDDQVEGMLISLESRKTGVEAVLFNEEELKVVTRDRIEVR